MEQYGTKRNSVEDVLRRYPFVSFSSVVLFEVTSCHLISYQVNAKTSLGHFRESEGGKKELRKKGSEGGCKGGGREREPWSEGRRERLREPRRDIGSERVREKGSEGGTEEGVRVEGRGKGREGGSLERSEGGRE